MKSNVATKVSDVTFRISFYVVIRKHCSGRGSEIMIIIIWQSCEFFVNDRCFQVSGFKVLRKGKSLWTSTFDGVVIQASY